MRTLRLICPGLVLACLACASAEPETQQAAPAVAYKRPPFDAKQWAANIAFATDCEAAAFSMREQNRDEAWMAMRACVEKRRYARGLLTQINTVVEHWSDDLTNRPDGPRVAARFIANRGGDAVGDVATMQRARIPLFTLPAAMAKPTVYKGRYLIFRAAVSDMRDDPNLPPLLTMAETSMTGAETVRNDYSFGISSSGPGSATVNFGSNASLGPDALGPGVSKDRSLGVTASGSTNVHFGKLAFNNATVVTGRIALGRLPEIDPFLEPGHELIVLARFDGVKPDDSGNKTAIVTMVAYFEPEKLMTE